MDTRFQCDSYFIPDEPQTFCGHCGNSRGVIKCRFSDHYTCGDCETPLTCTNCSRLGCRLYCVAECWCGTKICYHHIYWYYDYGTQLALIATCSPEHRNELVSLNQHKP